jgi:hypothetical protein
MRRCDLTLVAVVIGAGLGFSANAVHADCDAAKPAEPPSRFVLNSETAYDKKTGLTWMRCSYGQSWSQSGGCAGVVKEVDWDTAMALQVPGNSSWRVPQREELESIVATNCKRPAIDEAVFPATASTQYWTSTVNGPSHAWIVFFRTGMTTWNFLRSDPHAVRLVRSGP